MDGLDRLTQKITDDAKAQAEKIIAEAQKQADTSVAEAVAAAERKYAEATAEADKKAEITLSGYESGANSAGRKKLLSAKHELIKNSFDKAMNILENLSDADYFEVIYKIIKKFKTDKKSELLMCDKDLKRLPADFGETLNKISNGNITLSDEPAAIKNGFILRCGMVEENCSFNSLIGTDSEKLQDKVAEILFA